MRKRIAVQADRAPVQVTLRYLIGEGESPVCFRGDEVHIKHVCAALVRDPLTCCTSNRNPINEPSPTRVHVANDPSTTWYGDYGYANCKGY